MIKGIQITQSANAALLNSFWLLDEEKQQARCICAKGDSFVADQEVALSDLGQFEYRELPVRPSPWSRGSTPERQRAAPRDPGRRHRQPGKVPAADHPRLRLRRAFQRPDPGTAT